MKKTTKKTMTKMIVTDAVAECDVEKVELDVSPVSVSLKAEDGTEETFTLRCLFPESVDGKPFMEYVCHRVMTAFAQTEGEEQEFYLWLTLMLWFGYFFPDIDERRTRQFYIGSLMKNSATFGEIAEMRKTQGVLASERLVDMADKTGGPMTRLLQKAIYKDPDFDIPFSDEVYVAFRNQVLLEMMDVMVMLNEQRLRELEKLRHKVESDINISSRVRETRLKKIRVLEDGEDPSFVEEVCEPIMRDVFKRSMERERQFGTAFEDQVERARRLQEPVFGEVEKRGIEMLSDDDEKLTPEAEDCVRRKFDARAADALLNDVILRYEEICKIPSRKAVEERADEEQFISFRGGVTFSPEFYLRLVDTRQNDDVIDKWNALGWVTTNLIDRSECIRLLHREADAVWLGAMEHGFRQVYRKIKQRLAVHERRAFSLMYFRQPMFCYRIAVLDPVVSSFFTGMDDDTRALIFLVIILKVWKRKGMMALGMKLEKRWRAYLRVYPSWVFIIQKDESERWQGRRDSKVLTSFYKPIGQHMKGKVIRLEHGLSDPKSDPETLLQALTREDCGTVEDWAEKYCAPKQRKYIVKYHCDRKKVPKIAEEEGVKHQAVSKAIRQGRKRIKEGLQRAGLADQFDA